MHGFGERNDRKDRLIEFWPKLRLVVSNLQFKNRKQKITTRKGPGDECNIFAYLIINIKKGEGNTLSLHLKM